MIQPGLLRPPIMESLEVYTDGSCMGPPDKRHAGYGIYVAPNHPANTHGAVLVAPYTNQRAELMAARVAMQLFRRTRHLIIWTDSKYTIGCFTMWYRKWQTNGYTNGKGVIANRDIIEGGVALLQERERTEGFTTEFRYVPGHQNIPGNEAADVLAKKGAEIARQLLYTTG